MIFVISGVEVGGPGRDQEIKGLDGGNFWGIFFSHHQILSQLPLLAMFSDRWSCPLSIHEPI